MDCVFLPLDTLQKTLDGLVYPLILPPHLHQAVQQRQQSYLAGRACAQILYSRYGLKWDHLPMHPESHPRRGAPQWPKGFTGSISHSPTLAVASLAPLSRYGGIGIDAERVMSEDKAQRLRSQILHPAETWVKTPLDLTLVFSFKESIYKALHPTLQRFIGFQEVEILPPVLLNAFTFQLTWSPAPKLRQDLKRCFKTSPTFMGKGQWWGQPGSIQVFTQYSHAPLTKLSKGLTR